MEGIHVRITTDDCFRLMRDMQDLAETFKQTGGVHNAALCDANGVLLSRMDIGRHNALDKIYGYCLKTKLAFRTKLSYLAEGFHLRFYLKYRKLAVKLCCLNRLQQN